MSLVQKMTRWWLTPLSALRNDMQVDSVPITLCMAFSNQCHLSDQWLRSLPYLGNPPDGNLKFLNKGFYVGPATSSLSAA